LEKALKIKPDDTFTRHALKEAYTRLKQYDKAIDAYQKAMVLNPKEKNDPVEKRPCRFLTSKHQGKSRKKFSHRTALRSFL